jgi:glucose/mannose-6-phosphate isomerase
MPPRACFGYSFTQLLFVLDYYRLIKSSFKKDIENSIRLLDENEKQLYAEGKKLAKKLVNKIPVLYAEADMEGVAVRWRQQINENSKMLCWHNVIPEMNHNELVGWRKKSKDWAVLFLRNEKDYQRSQMRMEINKTVIKKYAAVTEIFSKGKTYLENALYLIHLGDWLSWHLAQEQSNIDATEVKVIDYLKAALVE